jgi:hypothetical protein
VAEKAVEGVRNAEDGKPERAGPNRGDSGKTLMCGMGTHNSAAAD